MNGNEPATKADLVELENSLIERQDRLIERQEMLRTEMQHMYDDLKETIRDVQTEILKAFYGFSESVQLHFKEIDKTDASLRSV